MMTITWQEAERSFGSYLRIEKSLSPNSVEAYLNDMGKLRSYIESEKENKDPGSVTYADLSDFLAQAPGGSDSARTQARMISGIRAFYKFLLIEGTVTDNPTTLLESPKLGLKLPEVLTIEEIDRLIGAIDLSKPEGHRNRAMIETMYSCGLRVSELVNMKLTDIHRDDGFVTVTGKGNKQRLVPVGRTALREIDNYFEKRKLLPVITDQNILFLNRRGKRLTGSWYLLLLKIWQLLPESAKISVLIHSGIHLQLTLYREVQT